MVQVTKTSRQEADRELVGIAAQSTVEGTVVVGVVKPIGDRGRAHRRGLQVHETGAAPETLRHHLHVTADP